MHIRFDDDIKIAGIGLVPWTRLGPERWLKDYKIASLYGVDAALVPHLPGVLGSAGTDPLSLKHKTPGRCGTRAASTP